MAEHIQNHDNSTLVAAFEHDGLFVWRPPSSVTCPGWECELKEMVGKALPVSLKTIPSKEELLDQLKALDPEGDWDTIDENWDEQLDLILQARPGSSRGREDRLYAEIVVRERLTYDDYDWPVQDLFKHDRAGTYWVFNPKYSSGRGIQR